MTELKLAGDCAADCDQCPSQEAGSQVDGPYRGGRLAAVAAAYFLGPLALAVAGAVLAGPEQITRFLGGTAGLALGLVAAALAARYTQSPQEVAG